MFNMFVTRRNKKQRAKLMKEYWRNADFIFRLINWQQELMVRKDTINEIPVDVGDQIHDLSMRIAKLSQRNVEILKIVGLGER